MEQERRLIPKIGFVFVALRLRSIALTSLLFFFISFLQVRIFADELSSSLNHLVLDSSKVIPPPSSFFGEQQKKNRFFIQMSGDQYLTQDSLINHENNYSIFSLGYEGFFRTKSSTYFMQSWVEQNLDKSKEFQLILPQAYLGWRNESESIRFSIGRKVEIWSLLDREWNMGFWSSLFRKDELRPKEQGLIGAFLQIDFHSGWEILGFISPFFLPDQGPQLKLEEGHFVSENRWFLPPNERIEIFDRESSIHYRLIKPDVNQIVFQPSWALRLKYGNQEDGLWSQVALSHKPMNQLHVGIEGYRSLALSNSFGSNFVLVHAGVVNHHMKTLEIGNSWRIGKFWLSFSEDSPDQPEMNSSWAQPDIFKTHVYGLYFRHRFPLPYLPNSYLSWKYMGMNQQLLYSSSEKNAAKNNFIGSQVNESIHRFPLLEGVGLKWEVEIAGSIYRRLSWQTQYTYSFPDNGVWFSTGLDIGFDSHLSGFIGMDILGVNSSSAGGTEERSLYSRFRQNDRIAGGLTYVF